MFAWADVAHFYEISLEEFLMNRSPKDRCYMVAYAETRAKMNAFDAEKNAPKKPRKKAQRNE